MDSNSDNPLNSQRVVKATMGALVKSKDDGRLALGAIADWEKNKEG